MNPTVYVETSVVSYLAARRSRDVVVAAYQEVTRDWWRSARDRFVLYASALVVSESRTGDPEAARVRLGILGTALGRGRVAMPIWQDLVDDHGFPAGYASVRRFVSTVRRREPGTRGVGLDGLDLGFETGRPEPHDRASAAGSIGVPSRPSYGFLTALQRNRFGFRGSRSAARFKERDRRSMVHAPPPGL